VMKFGRLMDLFGIPIVLAAGDDELAMLEA